MLARVSQDPPRILSRTACPVPAHGTGELSSSWSTVCATLLSSQPSRAHWVTSSATTPTARRCSMKRASVARSNAIDSPTAVFRRRSMRWSPRFFPALPQGCDERRTPALPPRGANGGYTLYSVAWNLRDDGGKLDPKSAAKGSTRIGFGACRGSSCVPPRWYPAGQCHPSHTRSLLFARV